MQSTPPKHLGGQGDVTLASDAVTVRPLIEYNQYQNNWTSRSAESSREFIWQPSSGLNPTKVKLHVAKCIEVGSKCSMQHQIYYCSFFVKHSKKRHEPHQQQKCEEEEGSSTLSN